MTKKHPEIDIVPFIPAQSRFCRTAKTLLIFFTAFAGVSAVLIAIIRHTGAVQ